MSEPASPLLPLSQLAALVVDDELPDDWATPFALDGVGIVARAAVLENEMPLP